jgi:hypothetical protein
VDALRLSTLRYSQVAGKPGTWGNRGHTTVIAIRAETGDVPRNRAADQGSAAREPGDRRSTTDSSIRRHGNDRHPSDELVPAMARPEVRQSIRGTFEWVARRGRVDVAREIGRTTVIAIGDRSASLMNPAKTRSARFPRSSR